MNGLEAIIRTTLNVRVLQMHDDEIASLVKEIREHRKWFGRALTRDETVDAMNAGIKKMARMWTPEKQRS